MDSLPVSGWGIVTWVGMQIEPIAHIRTCYGEKFGVPRQPGLVKEAWGRVEFEPDYAVADAVRGLEGFSHIWLVFCFHQAMRQEWKPTVRPPRLGGNDRVGVFASRSPFRPNPIGLSVVALDKVVIDSGRPELHVQGVDLVDGTPILDIKPYVSYSDAIEGARGGFVSGTPVLLPVIWKVERPAEDLVKLIESTLANDPRPAYQNEKERVYGCLISGVNVRWQVVNGVIEVLGLGDGV